MSFTEEQRQTLLHIAAASIQHGLKMGQPLAVDPLEYTPELRDIRASFVTLHKGDKLRGCIGTITAFQPLVSDVAYHAHAAAFSDHRFSPVCLEEFPELSIHVSVLSVPEPLYFSSEEQLLEQLRPGVDGLILQEGWHRGTFLPSVWESLPEPRLFLQQLKRKAGLPADYWSNTLKISRYITE